MLPDVYLHLACYIAPPLNPNIISIIVVVIDVSVAPVARSATRNAARRTRFQDRRCSQVQVCGREIRPPAGNRALSIKKI